MTHLPLVLENAGSSSYHLDIDEDMLIGDYVDRLVAELGYPRRDSLGSPVVYQLRVVSQQRPLPNECRFAEVRLVPQTRVVLESAMATFATQPIEATTATPSSRGTNLATARISRRKALTYLTFFGISGLGTGIAASVVPRLLMRRSARTTLLMSPTSSQAQGGLFVPRTATIRLRFTGHRQMVQSLGWSPDGHLLGSGSADAQLLIWRKTDGQALLRLPHQAPVDAVAWSPESQRIATGSANQVAFFTVGTGELLAPVVHQHTDRVTSLAWTRGNQQQVVSGALDRRAIVWNTTNYSPQTIFTKHAAAIEDVSWSPDGKSVASCSQGGVVRVWNAQSGQEDHAPFQDDQLPLRKLAFAPTDAFLAVGSDDGTLRLWTNGLLCTTIGNTNGGPVCQDIPVKLAATPSHALRALGWSPDGRILASGDNGGRCTLWRRETLQPLFSFTVPDEQTIHNMSWSPAGNEIAVASGPIITVWVLQT